MPSKRSKKLSGFSAKYLGLDIYRQPFRLLLPDGNGMYRTFLGSLLSIITLVLIITYGSFKASELFSKQDYQVQKRELLDFYEEKEAFGADDGFAVAAVIYSVSKG